MDVIITLFFLRICCLFFFNLQFAAFMEKADIVHIRTGKVKRIKTQEAQTNTDPLTIQQCLDFLDMRQ